MASVVVIVALRPLTYVVNVVYVLADGKMISTSPLDVPIADSRVVVVVPPAPFAKVVKVLSDAIGAMTSTKPPEPIVVVVVPL